MSTLTRHLTTLAQQGGDSFKTVADRSKLAARFAAKMAVLNIQIRQAEGISARILQNDASRRAAILQLARRFFSV